MRNRIYSRFLNNQQDYLKQTSNQYFTKIFNNILVTILKVKVSITLNTSTNVWICIFDYSKVLISIMITLKTNKLRSLFSDTDSLMCEIKTEDVHEGFTKDK